MCSKSKKRVCSFNEDLQKEFKFLRFESGSQDKSRLLCKTCGVRFSIAHGGRSDISQHTRSQKHKEAEKAACSSSSIAPYFTKRQDEDKVLASEGMFAYHTVMHGHSFRSNDCLSTLIKRTYEPKYSSARTKTEAIICNVLSPLSLEQVEKDLKACSSVSVIIDASNRKAEKLFPLMVRYFEPLSGVQTKILDFCSLPGETSEVQCDFVEKVIKEKNITDKVIALCADNTNTNFGGVNRAGKNNLFRKLQARIGKEIIGVGCGAHIVHNCLQTAVDCLPFDVECFAVKVYKYFHIYTVRVEELKEFCSFANVEYAKLLEHGSTRFSTLGPAIDRIILIYAGLRSYFMSQERCPTLLKQTFGDPCSLLWLMFASCQIQVFQATITAIQAEKMSATEVAREINLLNGKLQGRLDESFIPVEVRRKLTDLEESGEIKQKDFLRIVSSFYKNSIEYLGKWANSYGGSEKHEWILLRSVPAWSEIQSSLVTLPSDISQLIASDMKTESVLFDQWQCAKLIAAGRIDDWNTKNVSPSERWVDIFSKMYCENVNFDDLSKAVQTVLCLPGTSASVERVFSIMNNIWTSEKSQLNISTLRSMLMIRTNFTLKCYEFYELLLKNKQVLHKISSSEKYFWCKDK